MNSFSKHNPATASPTDEPDKREPDEREPLLAASATPTMASRDPETATTDNPFEQEVPEADQNRFALAAGAYLQTWLGLLVLAAVSVTLLAVALGEYSTKGDVQYQVAAVALLLGGLAMVLLTWVVKNSPYDMLEVLRATILNMREVGLQMLGNVRTLREQLTEQQRILDEQTRLVAERAAQLARQQTLLDTQAAQVQEQKTLLDEQGAQLAAAKTNTERMTLVSRQLGATVGSLMSSQDKLSALAGHFEEQIERTIAGERTALLETLTGLDEATERARVAADTSQVLTGELRKMSGKMEDLLRELKNTALEEAMEDIMHIIDETGDSGLRDKLGKTDAPLTATERAILFTIFTKVDETLREQFQANRDMRRSLQRTISAELERSRGVQLRLSSSSSHGSPGPSAVQERNPVFTPSPSTVDA